MDTLIYWNTSVSFTSATVPLWSAITMKSLTDSSATSLRIGRKIPDEVAVVSFDNSYYSDLCPVRITSLAHEVGKLGRIAAQLLLDYIDSKPCQSQSISWRLMQKESG